MDGGLIRVVPDRQKARSIMKMVDATLEMTGTIDAGRYPSNVLKEYYDILRELIAVIALLDGYKTQGEGAHKKLIEYLAEHYPEFKGHEIALIDDLRDARNRIAYNGFFITEDYLARKKKDILDVIGKLKGVISRKI